MRFRRAMCLLVVLPVLGCGSQDQPAEGASDEVAGPRESATLRCVGSQWAADRHEQTVATSPEEAAQAFVDSLNGVGDDAEYTQRQVSDRLLSDGGESPTVVEIDLDGTQFTASNFRENSSPAGTYTVSWAENDGGYDFQVIDTDDQSLADESFAMESGVGPYGYLAAFAGLDRSDVRSDPSVAAASSVVPFSYEGADGVVVTWWSDLDDRDGQVFACMP